MITAVLNSPFNFGAPPGGDPDFASVVLLLHCDGADGSTTFTDESNSAHAVTSAGTAQVSTTGPKFGTGSLVSSSSNSNIYVEDSADWHFGSGDLTIEFFAYFGTLSGNIELISQRETATIPPITIYKIGAGVNVYLSFNNSTWVANPTIASGSVLSLDTWHHIALTRAGSYFKLWVDGAQVGATYVSASAFIDYDRQLQIGGGSGRSYLASAKMDEIRITKGVARYTSSFTPPTQAFPDS